MPRKETKMDPTAQQLSSQWMTEAEKETETDKLIRKSKQSPFIPIGELSLAYLLRCELTGWAYFQNVCPQDSNDSTIILLHVFMRKDHRYMFEYWRLKPVSIRFSQTGRPALCHVNSHIGIIMQSRKGRAIRFMCCYFTSIWLFVSLLSLTLKSPAKTSQIFAIACWCCLRTPAGLKHRWRVIVIFFCVYKFVLYLLGYFICGPIVVFFLKFQKT